MFLNITFGQTIYIIDTRNDYQICLFFFQYLFFEYIRACIDNSIAFNSNNLLFVILS